MTDVVLVQVIFIRLRALAGSSRICEMFFVRILFLLSYTKMNFTHVFLAHPVFQ